MEAVDTARRAHRSAPGNPILASHLGLLLRREYERTGSLGDLNEAIDLGRAAASTDDPFHGPMIWNNLGTMLEARYIRLGDSADLAEAIAVARSATERTTEAYVQPGMFLATLARILRISGTRADLAEAEAAAERAIKATSLDSPGYPQRCALLALILLERGTPEAIDRAVNVSRRAAMVTLGSTHPDGQVVHVAAMALAARPDRRAQAIRYAQRALALTRPDDPARASIELSLGDWSPARAVEHYRSAALQPGAAPSLRCDAAHGWACAAEAAGDLEEAAKAYCHAVDLLPTTAPRGLGRADRERRLDRQTGLAAQLDAN